MRRGSVERGVPRGGAAEEGALMELEVEAEVRQRTTGVGERETGEKRGTTGGGVRVGTRRGEARHAG